MQLISIIMPVHNTEKYLPACLESIVKQTVKNWELIVVNDFSNDNSLEILNEFAQKDERIKVYSNNNKGLIKALQLGYKHSRGDFITRMDSDDIMLPHKLEQLSNALIQNEEASLAVGLVEYFSETQLGDGYKKYEQWLNQLTEACENYNGIYKECSIPSPAWMCTRSSFEHCGGFEPNTYPEDYDLAFRFYKAGFKCIGTKSIVHKWRDYSNRTSRTSDHYADNSFLYLKLDYFIELETKGFEILVWGAGKKGKRIAQLLIDKQLPFSWACNNANKIGHNINGKVLLNSSSIEDFSNFKTIITVANPEEQQLIRTELTQKGLQENFDFYFFC